GNPEHAAGLEITLTGCALRPTRATSVAVVGAEADVRVGPRPGDVGCPLAVPGGTVLHIGPARRGLRCWLAMAGGIAVAPVLGSRSTDTLAGLG
ncbi:biotin-dependent carboxyltransferase family protein, partial [Escherichia coli]|nr:biotin-dependent carboxyltransferase family protein [Escherichia coli]